MPTVLERINLSFDSGALDGIVGSQAGQLQQAISLITQLSSNPPSDLGSFVSKLSALSPPSFSIAGNVLSAAQSVSGQLPTNLDGLLGPAQQLLASFADDILEQLSPLLADAVTVARSVQQLLSTQLGCPQFAADNDAGPTPPPGEEPTPASAQRAQAVTAQILQTKAILDKLPAQVTPVFLLSFLLQRLGTKPRDRFVTLNLPVLDDLLEPLQTVASWSLLDAGSLGAQLAGSLDAFRLRLAQVAQQPLNELVLQLQAAGAEIPGNLGSTATALAQAYGALATVLQAGDTAAIGSALATLNAALDTFDAVRAPLTAVLATLPALTTHLAAFPEERLQRLESLLGLLQPGNLSAALASVARLPLPPTAAAVQAVQSAVQPVLTWLNDLFEALNLTALEAPIGAVATTLQQTSDQLTASLAQLAARAGALFQGAQDVIGGLNLDDLQSALLEQIEQFAATVRIQITAAFAPVRNALESAITAVAGAIDGFDPQAVVGALQNAVQSIAEVLNSPEVRGAIEQVKATIDAVATALQQLSFAPVTDQVIELIETMRQGLQAALQQDLPDAAKTAIDAGLSLLPEDLTPVTDPLLTDFATLLEQGPVPLLERVKAEPQKILDQLERFEPGQLIGSQLSGPFKQLMAGLNALDLRSLLAPAEAALEAQKRRLLAGANPGQALAPLSSAFAQINQRLDALSPSKLLEPLNQALQTGIDRISTASPVDEVFAVVNDVFASINSVFELIQTVQDLLTKIAAIIDSFADSDAQVDAWRDGLLDAVAAAAGPTVNAVLATLNQVLDGVRQADLLAQLDTGIAPLQTLLQQLDPGPRLAALAIPHAQCRVRAQALPPSATRTQALTLIERFDPLRAADGAALRELQALRDTLGAARSAVLAQAQSWNEAVAELDVLRTDGTLDGNQLRATLAGLLEPVFAPVRALFKTLESIRPAVAAIVSTVQQIITNLTGRTAALLTGPTSLQGISTTLQSLVDELRNFDLSILTGGLDDTLGAVRAQLNALDPARISAALNTAFAAALETISLELIIPDSALAELDAALDTVRGTLQALDPEKIVVAAVQPLYEDTLLPLAQAFDLTPVVQSLIDYLQQLDEELRTELGRVNSTYRAFISTRSGTSTSVSA
jgi:hypothetical protein